MMIKYKFLKPEVKKTELNRKFLESGKISLQGIIVEDGGLV